MNRRHRLRGRRRFATVRAASREARGDGVRVRAVANGAGVSRAGFAIVSAPSAVARNRLRRRLRALVAPSLVRRPGFDIVVTAPAELATVGAGALRASVEPLVDLAMARAGA